MIKNFLSILLFLNILFFSSFSFVQAQEIGVAQMPNTIEEAKAMGQGILPTLPSIFKNVGGDIMDFLKNLFSFAKNSWDKYLYPEIKKLIPVENINLKEELNREKTEMTESVKADGPKAAQGIWEIIKNTLKW